MLGCADIRVPVDVRVHRSPGAQILLFPRGTLPFEPDTLVHHSPLSLIQQPPMCNISRAPLSWKPKPPSRPKPPRDSFSSLLPIVTCSHHTPLCPCCPTAPPSEQGRCLLHLTSFPHPTTLPATAKQSTPPPRAPSKHLNT